MPSDIAEFQLLHVIVVRRLPIAHRGRPQRPPLPLCAIVWRIRLLQRG